MRSVAQRPTMSVSAATARQFVKQWSKWYVYTADELYTANIDRKLTHESIHALFLWKNGGKLSIAKRVRRAALCQPVWTTKSTSGIDIGRRVPAEVWWRPNMEDFSPALLETTPLSHLRSARASCDGIHPVWKEFSSLSEREVDKALWSFGKFLKQDPARRLLPEWKRPR
jgi:hypothetical protein